MHHAVLTPELHPTLAKLRALLQSSVDLYRSYDGLRPSLSGFMERAHGKKNKGGNGKVGRRGKLAGWGMQGRYTVETIEF